MWLRQSTAGQEILLGSFLDSTDGNTAETALTIANTDIKLWKEGAIVEANKNLGGATHIASGRYYAVLDATDSNTLGKLEINVHVAGALAVRREFMVLPAMIYDSIVLGTDDLDVNTIKISDTAQTANDNGLDINTLLTRIVGTLAAGTHNPATSAQIAVLSDWINGGRLDLILDIIAADVVNIDGAAMRGTDNAALAVSWTATRAGYIDELASANIPQDLADMKGATFDTATDSLEAIRNRGDSAWITGGGGGITDILNIQKLIPLSIDLANTATFRIGLMLINSVDDLPSAAEITPGTISIDRKAIGGNWSAIVTDAACSESAGLIYYDEVFDSGTGYAEGDSIRITLKSQKITVAANDYEISDATGRIFYTEIRQTMRGTDGANTTTPPTAAAIADAVLDEALSGHNVGGSVGKALRQIKEGTVSVESTVNDASATTTVFITALTEATSNHFIDVSVVFIDGALIGQSRPILSYNGTTKAITLDEALTEAPANGDAFIIKTDHVHPVSQIVDSILDEALSGHATAGTLGKAISDILVDTNELQTDWTNGGRLDLILDAIKSDTGAAVTLSVSEREAIADALLDRDMSTGTDSGTESVRTVRQSLRSNRNKVSISGGVMTVTKEDDSTSSWTAAIATTAGDPISSIDPT